ncbi:MAG TPA: energy transducer TonB [Vicinamibacterales bacterium]|nr:energy transducer TonB [Vicinamibacterales bacterium]
MPRDMFGDVVDPTVRVGSQAWYTVPLSIIAHVILFGAVIIIPLMATDVLPTPPTMMAFVGTPPAPPPPPPPPPAPAAAPKPVPVQNPNAAPIEAPKEIIPEAPAPSVGVSEGVPGGVEGGVPGGVMGGVVGGLPEAPPPPPPPPQAPVRVGGAIKPPTKVKDVRPTYPPIAQSARVQGVVIIEATIGANGRVTDAKVLRSIPLLDQAALDAVKQWVFTPTLLNGVPVPVIMTVTVNFTLQ